MHSEDADSAGVQLRGKTFAESEGGGPYPNPMAFWRPTQCTMNR
jgi:hypothetical protein